MKDGSLKAGVVQARMAQEQAAACADFARARLAALPRHKDGDGVEMIPAEALDLEIRRIGAGIEGIMLGLLGGDARDGV